MAHGLFESGKGAAMICGATGGLEQTVSLCFAKAGVLVCLSHNASSVRLMSGREPN